MHPHPLMDGYK